MSKVNLTNQSQASIATPTTGTTEIFIDSLDKRLKTKDDAGAVFDYSAAGASITQLTGEVTAGPGPGSVGATLSNSAVIGKVLTGLTANSGTILATDTIFQAFRKLVNKQNGAFYPNLSTGATVIASNTTLTSDLYCDTLTVNIGAVLFTNGYRVFAKTSITCNGTIDRSGTDATGTGATAALTAGTIGAGGAGGAGGNAAGSAGGASATGLGGAGSAGGLGSGGAGGAAGAFTVNPINSGSVEILFDQGRARLGLNISGTQITGGSGGGGGGGDGTAGGAGGAGGALMILCSRSITGTGTISAKGGNGFQPPAGNRGGGGGGGGGIIVTISENDVTATSLTFNVAGGTGASGSGTGASGVNGTNGRIYQIIA